MFFPGKAFVPDSCCKEDSNVVTCTGLNNTDGTPVLGPPVTGTINPHLYHNVKYNLLIHYCEIIKSLNRLHHLFFYINQRLHNPFNCFKHCILDKLIYIYIGYYIYISTYIHIMTNQNYQNNLTLIMFKCMIHIFHHVYLCNNVSKIHSQRPH